MVHEQSNKKQVKFELQQKSLYNQLSEALRNKEHGSIYFIAVQKFQLLQRVLIEHTERCSKFSQIN